MKEKYERHSRHGAALAGCLEAPGDNDTSAGEHGSRSGVRDMLQWERVLQGIRRLCWAILTYSVPHRGRENKNPWQGIMPCLGVWGLLFVEEKGNTGERVHIRQDEIHWGIGHTLCQI